MWNDRDGDLPTPIVQVVTPGEGDVLSKEDALAAFEAEHAALRTSETEMNTIDEDIENDASPQPPQLIAGYQGTQNTIDSYHATEPTTTRAGSPFSSNYMLD